MAAQNGPEGWLGQTLACIHAMEGISAKNRKQLYWLALRADRAGGDLGGDGGKTLELEATLEQDQPSSNKSLPSTDTCSVCSDELSKWYNQPEYLGAAVQTEI